MTTKPSFSRLLTFLISAAFVGAAGGQGGPPAQGAPPATQTGGAPGGQPGGGRGGAPPPPFVPYDDYTGYTKLWDGATLTNWDGETDVWSIVDGTLHADTTKTPGQHHIHYKGPGAVMRDFDFKVEVKISATGANGGIQYRSRLLHASHGGSIDNPLGKSLPAGVTTMAQAVAAGLATAPAARGGGGGGNRGGGANPPAAGAAAGTPPTAAATPPAAGTTPPPAGAAPAQAGAAPGGRGAGGGGGGRGGPAGPNGPTNEANPWQVSGYQFDLDSGNRYSGMLYEGQGRGIVMSSGTIVQLLPDRTTARIGTVTDTPGALFKPHQGLEGEWQQVQIIARGNTLIHMVNGKVISVVVDDNPTFRAFQGILSLQLEGSGQIWYRNVYVKSLDKPMEFPK
jgi:hypothetical protein